MRDSKVFWGKFNNTLVQLILVQIFQLSTTCHRLFTEKLLIKSLHLCSFKILFVWVVKYSVFWCASNVVHCIGFDGGGGGAGLLTYKSMLPTKCGLAWISLNCVYCLK